MNPVMIFGNASTSWGDGVDDALREFGEQVQAGFDDLRQVVDDALHQGENHGHGHGQQGGQLFGEPVHEHGEHDGRMPVGRLVELTRRRSQAARKQSR